MSQNPEVERLSDDDVFDDEESELSKVDDDFFQDFTVSPVKGPQTQSKNYVFLWKGKLEEGSKIITFPHPANGKKTKWIINDKKEILEIQKAKANASWFINNRVLEDGTLYLTSAVDPLFMVLPRLESVRKARAGKGGVYVSADQIWAKEPSADWTIIKECLNASGSKIDIICDVKNEEDETFYKLNDDKVVEWLKRKVDSICDYLEQMPDLGTLVRAQVAGFRARKDEAVTLDQKINIALGFLREYVTNIWINKLRESYGDILASQSTESLVYLSPDSEEINKKKRKLEALEAGSDTPTQSPAKKRRKLSEIQLEKVDKKNIPKLTTFFKKLGS